MSRASLFVILLTTAAMPLLLVGAASVVYWLASERTGAGNVIPYGVLQGYAVVMLLRLGDVVSGHSLKHLAAAFAGFIVCRMLWRRVLDPEATSARPVPTNRARRAPPAAGSASVR